MISGGDESLDTGDLQDQELVRLKPNLRRRGSLSIWFGAGTDLDAKPFGRRGRQQAYSDAAIQAA